MTRRSWISNLAPTGVVGITACLLAACGTDIEPRGDLKPGSTCGQQFGAAKVNALFSAINLRDVSAAEQLFPQDGHGEFRIQPILELAPSIVRSVETGRPLADNDADTATNRAEVGQLVSALSGLHFVFTAPLEGKAGTVEHVSAQETIRVREVDFGPVAWKATGPLLERYGKKGISGGGKIAVACDTGHIIRVTLGASTIES
jgi:hypothetical protein